MKYDELINFRWGSEAQAPKVKRKSLSRKWLFIKPDVGNLSAAPQTPFCSFNVVPYFGGYPTGFSTYEYCAWATPKKIKNNKLIGFTHFSFSGAGDLHNFHNYFLVKPCKDKHTIIKEEFSFNGFEFVTSTYTIKTIINDRCAFYKINSLEDVTIIPGFHGLTTEKYNSDIVKVLISQNDEYINIDADYGFVHLYWSLKVLKGEIKNISETEIVLSNDCEFIISFSTSSFENANRIIPTFDKNISSEYWTKYFKVFDIKDNSNYKKLFYTALMFALKKPYIYDEEHIYDFATMWDIYKTLLPFIYLFYRDEAKIITKNMLNLTNKDGLFYHANLFSINGPVMSDQAICLINISLSTAALYGVEFDIERAKELQKYEIEYYLKNLDKLDRTTYLLDLCDAIVAYYNAYQIDLGLEKVKDLIAKAFEKDYVYLNKKSIYYEGNYSNYSFRVSSSTDYRLQNKKDLNKALDKFFGFVGRDSFRFTKPTSPRIVKWYMKHCKRFEGLNNEPDMESMYLYSYLGEFDKQNKVIKDVVENSFSLKNNGVPGNDDNGGLSSWLAFNLLGIFPVVGTNKIKIGLPFLNEVKAGNLLIRRNGDINSYSIDKITFNDEPVINNEINVVDVINGGVLDIYLK